MFADVALLGGDAVAERGVEEPESGEGVGERRGRVRDFYYVAACYELAQRAGDVQGGRHVYFPERRDLWDARDLLREWLREDDEDFDGFGGGGGFRTACAHAAISA